VQEAVRVDLGDGDAYLRLTGKGGGLTHDGQAPTTSSRREVGRRAEG